MGHSFPFYGLRFPGIVLLTMLLLVTPGAVGVSALESGFDKNFTGRTLRFDYYHSGTAQTEQISLDELRIEGEWAGSKSRLLDDTNLGKYLIEVVDSRTNLPVYSRGFSSIYGEWETTGEASDGVWRTFHESQRFPEPRFVCQVSLKKRAKDGCFREIYSTLVDPESRFVRRAPERSTAEVWSVFENGPIGEKVDVLILGDGYSIEEVKKFRSDLGRLTDVLFSTEPFQRRRGDFNVRAICVPSQDSGISNPRSGVWKNTELGLSFNAFDLDRYVLSFENVRIRDISSQAPYDALIIVFNMRKYGGGGIFNLWATCAADTKAAPYVFVHEFGHSFAGLGDEYYTSQVAYEDFIPAGTEPWEPNITALLDPGALKWSDLVDELTPVPTPWDQESYDKASSDYNRKRLRLRNQRASEEKVEALFDEIADITGPLLGSQEYASKIGAFEGASYQAKGLYRPATDCIMFSRNPDEFCTVCERAIEQVIDMYSRP